MAAKIPVMRAAEALKLVLTQAIVTLIIAASLLLFKDGATLAYSALAGGAIAALANGWFALKVFGRRRKGEVDAATELRAFYWGEINKLVLTGALFVAAFVLIRPVSGAALIAAYFMVHMTPFVVSVFIKQQHTQKERT